MFEYIVINTVTREIVHEFEAEGAIQARRAMLMFNEDCKLYTAGRLNSDPNREEE